MIRLGMVASPSHTLNPNPAGAWTAPDRAAAQLIKESGTRGMQVTVWSLTHFADISRYLVKLLDSLGYHARLKVGGYSRGATARIRCLRDNTASANLLESAPLV